MTAKQGVNKDGVNTGVNSKKTTDDPINREPQAESKSHAEVKASSADIHNILRKTELRTVLRSKNRLFSTQGNGTQRSTQRKHENGQGGDDNFRQSLDETAP